MFLKKRSRKLSQLVDEGFHGDKHLQNIAFQCIERSDIFIETGANVGSTLKYVATNFNKKLCYSCEPHYESFLETLINTKDCYNIILKNEESPGFLYNLVKNASFLVSKTSFFWIDSHGFGFQWPLQDEIGFILENFEKCFVLIDDFKVPHIKEFGYDKYDGQECSFEYIKESIPDINYKLYYPNYKDKTSSIHPLRGWGLLVKGIEMESIDKEENIIISKDLLKNN